MLTFTIAIANGQRSRSVLVHGELNVHNATEFTRTVRQLNEALGSPTLDLTGVECLDEAAQSSVRTLARDMEEFGGMIHAPQMGFSRAG